MMGVRWYQALYLASIYSVKANHVSVYDVFIIHASPSICSMFDLPTVCVVVLHSSSCIIDSSNLSTLCVFFVWNAQQDVLSGGGSRKSLPTSCKGAMVRNFNCHCRRNFKRRLVILVIVGVKSFNKGDWYYHGQF